MSVPSVHPVSALNLLAFDTSTETLSVALARGSEPLLQHHAAGGAQASATLIPIIQSLLAHAGLTLAQLDAIAFGRGPGSFTGLRTACAVAQGLGFGAGVPLVPVDTLLAVAEQARGTSGAQQVVAVLDARMDEVYFGAYVHEKGAWRIEAEARLGRPGQIPPRPGWTIAGNALHLLAAQVGPGQPRVAALPTASALVRLAPALIAGGHAVSADLALPLYIRDKVAQTTHERAAAQDAKSAAAARPKP